MVTMSEETKHQLHLISHDPTRVRRLLEPYWGRQPREATNSWLAFRAYRDQGPERTLLGASKAMGMGVGTVTHIAKRWLWAKRVGSWDEELDRRIIQAKVRLVEEMAHKQAQLGLEMQEKAREALWAIRPYTEEYKEEDGRVIVIIKSNIGAKEVAALAKIGSEIERLARGEPTEIIDIEGQARRVAEKEGLDPEMVMDEFRRIRKGA